MSSRLLSFCSPQYKCLFLLNTSPTNVGLINDPCNKYLSRMTVNTIFLNLILWKYICVVHFVLLWLKMLEMLTKPCDRQVCSSTAHQVSQVSQVRQVSQQSLTSTYNKSQNINKITDCSHHCLLRSPVPSMGHWYIGVCLRFYYDLGPSNPTTFLGLCTSGDYRQWIESLVGVSTFNYSTQVHWFGIYVRHFEDMSRRYAN